MSTSFADWVRQYAMRADTIDPDAPLDDLEPLRELIGDARVVGIGESAHHVAEFYRVRHRVNRFLVERCGFDTYVFEAPLTEADALDAWVAGAPGPRPKLPGMGLDRCDEFDAHMSWLRRYNADAPARRGRFAGAVPGSGGGMPLPELTAIAEYLRAADPDALPLAEQVLTAIGAPARGGDSPATDEPVPMRWLAGMSRDPARRDAVSAAIGRLLGRMETMRRPDPGYARALARLRCTWYLDQFHRDSAGLGLALGTTSLDAAMAEWVLHLLAADPSARVVLGLHNVHLRRTPIAHDGPSGLLPAGYHLARELGERYVAIALTGGGGTVAAGRMDPALPAGIEFVAQPAPPVPDDCMEAAFGGAGAPLTVADLRAARHAVGDTEAYRLMRMEHEFAGVPVFDAFDAIAYLPRTSCTDHVTGTR
ncbi:hypothetical protein Athai_14530 [Actinocatenispora thailandica]|uniref:Erythromycin esterase n=1 Tax=Actinocatenispora thailandica TaxID=227318 RepID=A0A7R7DLX1_9ACTN|nr:erythromycin esterase family protein [Actinocatenispora thailandica]BCJ33950.1 hypothetical protein Athai_14530 [Actinocatenispora thailandica]